MMWSRTDLIELLEIEHPILQAPMSGAMTPELAVAVGNAGGLGGYGCTMFSPAVFRDHAGRIRAAG